MPPNLQTTTPPPEKLTHRKKLAKRTNAALWLLIGPTVVGALVFIAFAIINLIFNPTFWPTPDTESFADTPLILTAINILLFTLGSISIIAWLPGIIVGALLLIKRPKADSK